MQGGITQPPSDTVEVAREWRREREQRIASTLARWKSSSQSDTEDSFAQEPEEGWSASGEPDEPWKQLLGPHEHAPKTSYGAVMLPGTVTEGKRIPRVIRQMKGALGEIIDECTLDIFEKDASPKTVPNLPPSTKREPEKYETDNHRLGPSEKKTPSNEMLFYMRKSRAYCWYSIYKLIEGTPVLANPDFADEISQLKEACARPLIKDATAAHQLAAQLFGTHHCLTLAILKLQLVGLSLQQSSHLQRQLEHTRDMYLQASNSINDKTWPQHVRSSAVVILEDLRAFVEGLSGKPKEAPVQSVSKEASMEIVRALNDLLQLVLSASKAIWRTQTELTVPLEKTERRLSMLPTSRTQASESVTPREYNPEVTRLIPLHISPAAHVGEFEIVQSTWPLLADRPIKISGLGSPHLTLVPLYSLLLHYCGVQLFPRSCNTSSSRTNRQRGAQSNEKRSYVTKDKKATIIDDGRTEPTKADLRAIKSMQSTLPKEDTRISENDFRRFLDDFGIVHPTKCSQLEVTAVLCCVTSGDLPVLVEGTKQNYKRDDQVLSGPQYAERSNIVRKYQIHTLHRSHRSLVSLSPGDLHMQKNSLALPLSEAGLKRIPPAKLLSRPLVVPDDADPNGKYSLSCYQFLDAIARIGLIYMSRSKGIIPPEKTSYTEKIKMFFSNVLELYCSDSISSEGPKQLIQKFVQTAQLQQSGKSSPQKEHSQEGFKVSVPPWDWAHQLRYLAARRKLLASKTKSLNSSATQSEPS